MPGVPPDAVAQVKKGLRGLFSRRKSRQGHQQSTQPEPTSSSSNAPTATQTAAAAAPAIAATTPQPSRTVPSTNPPPPQPAQQDLNKAPQLSEPSQSEIGKDIDLNPSAAGDAKHQPSQDDAVTNDKSQPTSAAVASPPSKTEVESPKPIATDGQAAALAGPTSTGMSATSGPLGDHLEEGFIDDDVGPKGETKAEAQAVAKEAADTPEKLEEIRKAEDVEKAEKLGEGAKA